MNVCENWGTSLFSVWVGTELGDGEWLTFSPCFHCQRWATVDGRERRASEEEEVTWQQNNNAEKWRRKGIHISQCTAVVTHGACATITQPPATSLTIMHMCVSVTVHTHSHIHKGINLPPVVNVMRARTPLLCSTCNTCYKWRVHIYCLMQKCKKWENLSKFKLQS